MVPPPSQAGRFKPRKPPAASSTGKKISMPGANMDRASSVVPGRGGRRGGGRGDGGRGRGRGRSPLPRGQVFFTGNAPPETISSGGRGGRGGGAGASSGNGPSSGDAGASTSKKRVTIKLEGKFEASDEIIVGELDEAIGTGMSAQDSKRSALSGNAAGGNRAQSMFEDDAAIISSSFSIPDFYDSDSSDEGRKRTSASRRDAHAMKTLQPAQLPFPDARVPVGIGPVSTRPSLYCDVSSEEDLLKVFSMSSPFANRNLSEVSRRDEDNNPWFLVQLPTRLPLETGQVAADGSILPPAIISSDDNVMPATSSDMNNNNGEESMIGGALSDFVSVPPLLENAFDNVLTSTTASSGGKLGRISVYKSGKTIFTMGDTQFLVSEGLPCGFSQQAALLEVEDANYIPLGSIGKTIVVTPNVKEAFST